MPVPSGLIVASGTPVLLVKNKFRIIVFLSFGHFVVQLVVTFAKFE
jgi:hypothetical protein